MTRSKNKKVSPSTRLAAADPHSTKHVCGLCGKADRLTRTECCGNWICDDEDEYVLFSHARNSCYRNHRRYTLCGYHRAEEHTGSWKSCSACREEFETELYVHFATNEYNFEKLENPPAFEPTRCAACGTTINLGEDGYSQLGKDHWCEGCGPRGIHRLPGQYSGSEPNSHVQQPAGAPSVRRPSRGGKKSRRG
jgi:hypothetical protein